MFSHLVYLFMRANISITSVFMFVLYVCIGVYVTEVLYDVYSAFQESAHNHNQGRSSDIEGRFGRY